MQKFKLYASEILIGLGVLAFVTLIGWGVYAHECYQIELYKKKYPGTSTFDYWMDSSRK